jgi:hypothetical protein
MRTVDDPLLPTRRSIVTGIDHDGNRIELSHSISRKLYRCPGCRASIPIGSDHVLVRITAGAGSAYHQHWHRVCARQIVRDLKEIRRRDAV